MLPHCVEGASRQHRWSAATGSFGRTHLNVGCETEGGRERGPTSERVLP
jgi:hypothetical protein